MVLVRQALEVSAIGRCSTGAGLHRQQDASGGITFSVPELVTPLCPRRRRHLVIVRGGAALGVSPPSGVVLDFMGVTALDGAFEIACELGLVTVWLQV